MNAEEALIKLPAEIRRVENETFKRKQDLEGLRLKMRLREADLAQSIAIAMDGEKKRYPNADSRDAALRAQLEVDNEAKAIKRQLVEEEGLISRMQSTLDYYRDTQRNARVLLLARSPSTLVFEDPELAR